MRSEGTRYIIYCILFFTLVRCNTKEQNGEQLAKQYCSSCHVFPDPSLLDKKSWEKGVLPRMAFRMGLDNMKIMSYVSRADYETVYKALPENPMVSDAQWEAIKNYFISHAPDSLHVKKTAYNNLNLFDISTRELPSHHLSDVVLVKNDTITNSIYVGTRSSELYRFSEDFVLEDSFKLKSPPSSLKAVNKSTLNIALLGIMDPNDAPAGEITYLSLKDRVIHTFIDSLKRPDCFAKIDLNNDHLDDYIICNFGNYTGSISIYEQNASGKFTKKIVSKLPGARRVITGDFNHDGLKDFIALLTQGNEQITLFSNQGNMTFESRILLRFPPVYGSSYLDTADFNHDGKMDLLYSNGDNADYSPILKPYHGVRIFLNKGDNKFSESWFGPMPGASKAIARDFDKDGDIDIAAISFFPDFKHEPEAGFIYFENKNKTFIPHCTPLAKSGRWLVMNVSDLDKDGDLDIILGALAFPTNENTRLVNEWYSKKAALLIMRNKTVK